MECAHCHVSFQEKDRETHEKTCENRQKTCEFCKIPYGIKEFAEHYYECGSRTRLCEICGKYIRLLELPYHETRCSQEKSAEIARNPGFSSKNMRNLQQIANLEAFYSISSEEYEPEPEENKSFHEKHEKNGEIQENPKKYSTRTKKNCENKEEKPAKERVISLLFSRKFKQIAKKGEKSQENHELRRENRGRRRRRRDFP